MILVCLWMGNSLYANAQGKDIPMAGNWDEGNRSIIQTLPVSAFLTEDILIIQSSTLRSDITITIVQGGTEVYKQTVPAAQTANIMIPIKGLESGSYTLELRNQWGGYLYGDFVK